MLYVNTCKIDKLPKTLCHYDLFNLKYTCNDHEQEPIKQDYLEVITRCCAVSSGLRQATVVELWTYTVIIKRDEKFLQHEVNEVMKMLKFWFKKTS